MSGMMKLNRTIGVALILIIQAGLNNTRAQTQDIDVKALLRRIEELEQKVKTLERERELEVKEKQTKSRPIEELEQKVKILERQRELEGEAAAEKLKEGGGLFKVPSWLTSVRLQNDLRLRYDA